MKIITRKSEVKILLAHCLSVYTNQGLDAFILQIQNAFLVHRVKFPLLEYCAVTIHETIAENEHISFCDKIHALKTEGGNVLLGIMLQKRLNSHFKESIQKTTEYIAVANIWYVCDIIGERVFGYSLLHEPKKTIPVIRELSVHPANWVIRSLGAGTHYAIKKGLDKIHVKTMFCILLSIANTKDKEIRQGIGWAAKTTAKFHPDIIKLYKEEIENTKQVANWFRKKIEIGLYRNSVV